MDLTFILKILYIGRSSEGINELRTHTEVSVIHKTNALEAVNYLKSGNMPDAVLSEMAISGGEGFEMHQWLRDRPEYDRMAFILVDYEFKEDLFKKAFTSRVDDFFVLPMPSAEKMIGRIRFLVEFRNKYSLVPFVNNDLQDVKYAMPLSKRMFDLLVAISALIVLSPILLLIVLAIRLESKGKVYYISKRVGREPFDFYKLRSMKVGADKELNKLAKDKNQYVTASVQSEIDFSKPCPVCAKLSEEKSCSPILHIGPHNICDYWYNTQKREVAKTKSAFIKIVDDPRITKVGKFIRNTSIDELPQLINVIKGDMSIVGNRPLPVYEAELLTRGLLSKRFLAPAGITGLWQVELRGKGGVMSEDERMRLDNEYADHFIGNNYSFWYDLKLILRTVPALFQKDTV
ncbi:MAG TPA: sugar transferase [Prolixibacteraceae bacterium]|nr:sugar transferase [Prolixibacteraceae bacterium]